METTNSDRKFDLYERILDDLHNRRNIETIQTLDRLKEEVSNRWNREVNKYNEAKRASNDESVSYGRLKAYEGILQLIEELSDE